MRVGLISLLVVCNRDPVLLPLTCYYKLPMDSRKNGSDLKVTTFLPLPHRWDDRAKVVGEGRRIRCFKKILNCEEQSKMTG